MLKWTGERKKKRPQPRKKNYRQLWHAKTERNSLTQGKECQFQMGSPENIYSSTIIQTYYLYLKIYMYVQLHICMQ